MAKKSISTRIIDTPVSHVRPRQQQCKMADGVDLRCRLRLVTGFLTAKGSNPTESDRHGRNVCDEDATDVSSDVGSVDLRAAARSLITGPAAAYRPWQRRQMPKIS